MLLLFETLIQLLVTKLQRQFLNYAARMLHVEHRPHDCEPVRKLLGLSNLTGRRIANRISIQKLIHGMNYRLLLNC